LLKPEIVSGRWLAAGDSDAMVVNTALAAKRAEMRVGNRVTLPLGTFRVVGIVREPFSPAVAYVPRHDGMTNSLRLALDQTDPASIDRVKGQLEESLGREGIKAANMTSLGESRFGFDQHMVMIYVALIVMSALIGGVGALGLMTTMSINVLERRREMGVLRAVGATPRMVWLMLVGEGVVVGVFSWILASLAAWPLSRGVGNFMMTIFRSSLDSVFELRGLFIWLAVSLLLGAIASFVPARHATRQPVREALGYE
jgi:putative ABC transport system permease protein